MLALGHEVVPAQGAVLVRNRDLRDIWDANHAQHVCAATPAAIDELLARMEEVYAASGHRRLDCDFTTPAALEARLVRDGFRRRDFLYVQPAARGRGIAAALLHHGIADCRRHGAKAVVIVADADDTPRAAYARMGFAPVAIKREYVRRVAS